MMTSMLVSIVLVALAQGWDRPAMESSELAAPGTVQTGAEAQTPAASEDLDSVTTAAPQAQEVKTRWEYDEEGKPVARVEEAEAPLETKPVAAPEEKSAAKTDARQEKNTSGRIATFWFIMPRR